jgi:hypothetical protein
MREFGRAKCCRATIAPETIEPACALLARRPEASQITRRLKNNLLPSAEIGFVSPWCFMQAIKRQRKPGHERTWRPQQIA